MLTRFILLGLLAALPAHAATKADRDLARQLEFAGSVARVGQWDMAARMYREATQLAPGSGAAWLGLGRALLESGQYSDARAALEHGASLQPGAPGLAHLQGRVAIGLGLAAEAEQFFRAAVDQAPADPRAWTGLGVSLDLQRRHQDAQKAYARALGLDPLGLATRNNLALSLALEGRTDDARTRLRAIADASPRARANLLLIDAAAGPTGGRRP